MFPDARISLRRWSLYAETKIPIPMAITLHNFVAPNEPTPLAARDRAGSCDSANSNYSERSQNHNESPASSPNKEEKDTSRRGGMWLLHRQPQYTNNLLPNLRMDISATHSEEEEEEPASLLYSQPSTQAHSLHPSWEHLDERISVEDCEDWWNENKLYKSMKVKLSVVQDNSEKSADNDCFLQAYLHPSFLERIDLLGSSSNQNEDPDDLMEQSMESKLPPSLPPNALLVHFSDGSIRCPPNTYQLLWDAYGRSVLEPPPVEDFSRFEDDAFATLDNVEQTPRRPRMKSVSSLLDQDAGYVRPQDDSREENLQTPPRTTRNTARELTYPQHETNNANEQEIAREERRQEKLELLRLIAQEERALEDDLHGVQTEQETLKTLVEEVRSVELDISKVQIELSKQSLKLDKEEILKESQSFKLLRDLRDIYPIAPDSAPTPREHIIQSTRQVENTGGTTAYLIRGLRLPTDIYATTISEEEVNTSLGYCAHLVFMVAKYLGISLRHRIFCNGSRSAIELDGVGIFPLFLGRLAARALEREQVDRGARLLGTNVDCIRMHLDLPSKSSSHILERLQTILEFVEKGK